MDMTSLLISMSSMGGLGAFFAIGLAIADKKLHVDEDPRISLISEELPGANCGGCGYPGCGGFAEAVVAGKTPIGGCPVNTEDGVEAMSEIMGVKVEIAEKKVARIFCAGGDNETAKKGIYIGIQTCLAGHLAFGADKLCQYGCLGFGDCLGSCPFDAMRINGNGLPEVDEELCTGCGNCVDACPRQLIELHPQKSHNLFILCKNHDEAKHARSVCIKACVGCKSCAKGLEKDQIKMDNNLAVVNYDLYGKDVKELPTKKCPNNIIMLNQ